ncbi:MAG: hypothetical protein U5P41_09085 [Gammaproteobacteria bacterium]|nr:hypothetical protein [Gammaproteobacteria bacterium]
MYTIIKAMQYAAGLPASIPFREWPVRDVDIIRRLARYYPVLYSVFLREARRPYGMDQMAEYYQSITFWHCFLKHVSPDLLVYNSIPAHIYDFLPDLLADDSDINTLLLLEPYHIAGTMTPTNRFEEHPKRIVSCYNRTLREGRHTGAELNDSWKAYYKRMTGTYEDVVYEDFKRRYVINHKSDRVKLKETILKKIYFILTGKRSKFFAKVLGRELQTMHRRWALRSYYHLRAVKPDYNAPYVFVPLHVQPERTSIPQGGVFGQQLLMIEMLSRALPEGWTLYVKEHPVQLYDRPVFKFFRTSAFYREILRFPNVQLVPARISARKLVDHCRAVASVTSTVCWEGLFQGKPALVFGHEWYSFCEGVFHIPDDNSCIDAMSRNTQDGYSSDQDRLAKTVFMPFRNRG